MTTDKPFLIVDDDDAIRALLVTVLRRRGHVVHEARNGAEALTAMQANRYVIVLLDLMMPFVSGWDVIDALSEAPPENRPIVIVLTAGTEPRNLNSSMVAATIRKPFDIQLLVDTVIGCVQSRDGRVHPLDETGVSGNLSRPATRPPSDKPN